MSLKIEAIDRLFNRLAATYGAQWTRMWQDMPIADAKTAWAHELFVFSSSLHRIAWALENLPERCPNAIEFKRLCMQAPAPEQARLPEPKADPERVKAELAKLGEMRKPAAPAKDRPDPGRDWARAILTKHRGGLRVSSIALRFAREAMGEA